MYIHVKVTPNSKEEEIEEVGENKFKIKTKAKAERNMANKAVIGIIARHFSLREADVRILNGHNSPSKLITVAIPENTKI